MKITTLSVITIIASGLMSGGWVWGNAYEKGCTVSLECMWTRNGEVIIKR